MFSYSWCSYSGRYVVSEKNEGESARTVAEFYSKEEAEAYVNWRNSQTRYERDGTT